MDSIDTTQITTIYGIKIFTSQKNFIKRTDLTAQLQIKAAGNLLSITQYQLRNLVLLHTHFKL